MTNSVHLMDKIHPLGFSDKQRREVESEDSQRCGDKQYSVYISSLTVLLKTFDTGQKILESAEERFFLKKIARSECSPSVMAELLQCQQRLLSP